MNRIIIGLLIIATSCGRNEEKLKAVEFSKFNIALINDSVQIADWRKSPIDVALAFENAAFGFKNKTIKAEGLNKGENMSHVKVTITNEEYLDDSINGEILVVELRKDDLGYWEIISAKKGWKCKSGRGAQSFGTENCE